MAMNVRHADKDHNIVVDAAHASAVLLGLSHWALPDAKPVIYGRVARASAMIFLL